MLTTLRVLIVEDSEDDALLLLRELRRGNWEVLHERVDTSAAMSAALDGPAWDVIIADYSMPNFSGSAALELAHQRAKGVPFVLISGVVGEEIAVLAMKAGADDYLSKGNLARLVPAIVRELREAEVRRAASRIAEELRHRERQLADALRIGCLGTWYWTLDTGAGVWSDQACAIIRGKPCVAAPPFEDFVNYFHPADRDRLRELMRDPATKQFAQDFQTIRDDGSQRFVFICGDITRDGDGLPIELAGMIQDVTERRRFDHELSNAKESAEAANRSKSEFLANMSHEIRTPMSAILGFADMALNENQDQAGRIECARIIQRNAFHLLELINEILDLSKIEASAMKIERISCDLPVLLSEIVSLMRPKAIEKGLGFGVSFDGLIPRVIQIDPMRLRQILINLLGNAVKFTESGTIQIRVTDDGTGGPNIALRFEVIDSGIGMAPEHLERLFLPFAQGDDSITRKFGGTGLGLTISRRLAKLLSGDVTVTSDLGRGSTFTLTIDGGPSEGVELLHGLTEASLPTLLPQGTQVVLQLRGRILLAEDGRDNQRLLRMQLSDAGAAVVSAANGKIAVDLASAQPFDLILMDMQMPVMDGYTATTELRNRGIKIPIVALTANAMADDRAKCIASGCDDYLSKPVTEETLVKTVGQHLRNDSTSETPDSAAGSPSPQSSDGSGTIKSSLSNNPRMQTIIPDFVEGLPKQVRKMIDLLEGNDLTALQKVVHQLLGASGGYGFEAVTEPAAKAEESIKTGKALDAIAAEVKALIEVIRRIDGYDGTTARPDAKVQAK